MMRNDQKVNEDERFEISVIIKMYGMWSRERERENDTKRSNKREKCIMYMYVCMYLLYEIIRCEGNGLTDMPLKIKKGELIKEPEYAVLSHLGNQCDTCIKL